MRFDRGVLDWSSYKAFIKRFSFFSDFSSRRYRLGKKPHFFKTESIAQFSERPSLLTPRYCGLEQKTRFKQDAEKT